MHGVGDSGGGVLVEEVGLRDQAAVDVAIPQIQAGEARVLDVPEGLARGTGAEGGVENEEGAAGEDDGAAGEGGVAAGFLVQGG